MDAIYQEIRDFCVREYEQGHEVGWSQLEHHLRDCGYSVSDKSHRGLGQMVSATHRRLDSHDEIGKNALEGYWSDYC